MYFTIFIILILVVSLVLLGRIVWRHLPELRVLDISAIPEEKREENKKTILETKFLRQKKTADKKIRQIISPVQNYLSGLTAKMQTSIRELENKYKRPGEVEEVRLKSINELFAEAKTKIAAQDFGAAEKDLIEIISRDRKNLESYKLLAEMYRLNRNYSQAEEIIKYLIKLKSLKYRKNKNPESLKKVDLEAAEVEALEIVDVESELANYYDSLAAVYELMDKKDKALEAYLKANAILPNNPKFLDKVIDLAIAVGDQGLARKTYRRLKEINPENAKLEQFLAALEKLP